MQKLTFRSRISWVFSIILTASLSVLAVVFFLFYFSFNLINRQTFVVREAKEISEKHLSITNGEIFFKRDGENNTLSSYLRTEGLSAVFFDKNRQIIGTYGIYVELAKDKPVEFFAKKIDLDKTLYEGDAPFELYSLHKSRYYLVLFYPIVQEGEVLGVMALSSDMNFGPEILVTLMVLVLVILVSSIIIGWLVTYFVVSKQFVPLNKILKEMNEYEPGKESNVHELNGNANDEIVRLSKSFRSMVSRVNEGAKKQIEFITNASHELKTPLTNSLLSLELVSMDLNEKKFLQAKKKIDLVKHDIKKYGDLINSLLEIAKIEDKSKRGVELQMSEIITTIVSNQKNRNDLKIETRVSKKIKLHFPLDHFTILASNLISNAIKYTKKGGKIIVTFSKLNGGELIVANEVRSLAPKDLDKMWHRYNRLRIFKKITGNGIGLYLVKEIADHHGLIIHQNLNDGIYKVTISGFC